ncbi:hypothetical protein GCM10027290_60790 [Micromonospora sonneratiae]
MLDVHFRIEKYDYRAIWSRDSPTLVQEHNPEDRTTPADDRHARDGDHSRRTNEPAVTASEERT